MHRYPRTLARAAGVLAAAAPALAQTHITVDASQRRQTIEGLGATATGTWDRTIVELFRQPAFAAQLVNDLGLSMVRIELPPEIQPVEDLDPTVLDPARFDFRPLQTTGTLASKLNAAGPGTVKVIGTIWTPPGWMKTNGQNWRGGELRADRIPHFAKYCAGVSLGFERTFGVPLYALSPQNEPVFWEPYNSCTYSPERYRDTVAAIAGSFAAWHARSRVYAPEDVGTDPTRWLTFVNYTAGNAAARQRVDAWAIHSYPWQNGVDATSPAAWTSLRQQVQGLGKPIWVSEVSGEDPSWLGTPENPRGAIVLARQIQDALVYGEVTAYTYWAIADPAPSKYALMGAGLPTKKYHAARQFFRPIRPGAVRLVTSGGDASVSASAFIHDELHTMTVVLINSGAAPVPVQVTFSGTVPQASLAAVRTSETDSSAALAMVPIAGGTASLTLAPQSVTTLTGPTEAPPAPCYANCDGSSTPPVLSFADFSCFLQRFASGDPWANCDASTTAPVLNANDFACFLLHYGAGCP